MIIFKFQNFNDWERIVPVTELTPTTNQDRKEESKQIRPPLLCQNVILRLWVLHLVYCTTRSNKFWTRPWNLAPLHSIVSLGNGASLSQAKLRFSFLLPTSTREDFATRPPRAPYSPFQKSNPSFSFSSASSSTLLHLDYYLFLWHRISFPLPPIPLQITSEISYLTSCNRIIKKYQFGKHLITSLSNYQSR